MNETSTRYILQHLRQRHKTIANAWYQAIAHTGFAPYSSAALRQHLVDLTDQAITVLLAEPFDRMHAEAIGTALARLHYLQSEAMGRTISVLADQLLADLPADAIVALQPALGALLGAVATGFMHESQETILGEQEQIREALLIERMRIADALQDSEALYRSIAENTNDLISVLDQEGYYLYASPAFQRILGDPPEHVIGTRADMRIHPDDQAVVLERWKQLAAGRALQARFRYCRADGAWCWLEMNATLMQRGDQAVIVAVGRDITEQLNLETYLRRAQKLGSVGQLACGAAHEFNNQLTGINAYIELALKLLPPGHEVRHDLEEIQQICVQSGYIAQQLLAFGRQQPIASRVIDLNDHICDMAGFLRHVIGEDIEVVTILTAEPALINIDPGQLEQLLVNLTLNARDAMPDGGRLFIETCRIVVDAEYASQHTDMQAGPYVVLTLNDTGMGMTPEVQAQIFEPFFTTKDLEEGTGLGLTISYGIVKQHAGSIWVYSEPQRGTTFKIYLPCITHGANEVLSPPDLNADLPDGTETLLLVEDEPVVLRLTAQMLRSLGYTVLEASNGDEALRIAQTYSETPIHILMTDVVLPKVSGQRVAAQLLRQRPEIKVLFTSGYTESVIIQRGQLAPDAAFMPKPFSRARLAHKIREVLDSKREMES